MRVDKRYGFTLVELLVVIAIIGILVALLLPAVQAAREAARRTQCTNNLKQIALAVHGYHDARGKLPAGCYWDESPSWMVLILPYLEEANLHAQWDLTARWWRPVNTSVWEAQVSMYRCPSRSRPSDLTPSGTFFGEPHPAAAVGDYAGNAGNDAVPTTDFDDPPPYFGATQFPNGVVISQWWGDTEPMKPAQSILSFRKIEDGLSNTFLAGEKHVQDGNWQPSRQRDRNGIGGQDGAWCGCNEWPIPLRLAGVKFPLARGPDDDFSFDIFGSWHPGICQFALCDGSVRAINIDINADTLERLANRQDGEIVDAGQF